MSHIVNPHSDTPFEAPGHAQPRLMQRAEIPNPLSVRMALVSRWIDEAPANAVRDPEAAMWGRVAKVAEETGEVIQALIGATGQNPRKGQTHTLIDVAAELLDVAVTALAAYEHLTGNRATCIEALDQKTFDVWERSQREAI